MTDTQHTVMTTGAWIAFVLAQVLALQELPLTFLALVLILFLFLRRTAGEVHLFCFGLALGLLIEVGMGMIARTQHWENASFFGVPYWLPLLWGYAFVVMRRVGNLITTRYS